MRFDCLTLLLWPHTHSLCPYIELHRFHSNTSIPKPSKLPDDHTTSPVIAIVLPLAKAVAVAALPVQLPELPEVLPVTLPVNGPANPVAVKTPLLELKVRLLPDFGARFPVSAVANSGKHVVSEDSSATVTVVAMAAVPVVSWFSVPTTKSKVPSPSS